MKLTKQLKAEIADVYEAFWGALFYADIDMYSQFLDEDYRLIGTTEQEYFFSKAEAVRFLKATADQLAGNLERRNSRQKIEIIENLVFITDQFDAYVLIDDKWSFYEKTRVSTLLHEKRDGWKIIQQHFSFPDNKAGSGQTIGLEKITKENLQLKEAIRRRTIELELKNKELEIEFSLERVRAVAMGMKQPADMLEVCEVITRELISLGVGPIRNIQTAVIDEAKKTYQNYEYFKVAKKKLITAVAYKEHKVVHAFVKRMLKDPEGFFTKNLKGEELKNWIRYQATAGQFVDPSSKKAASIHYYFYSIGPGALGISTYAPLSREAISLFKRFRNVFQLAYARFIDIQQALAQAFEARIEASLEKVRAQALGMRKPEDLPDVCEVLFKELQSLGFAELRNAMVNIHNDANRTFVNYDYSDEIGKSITPLFYDIHPVIKKQIRQIRSADDAFSETVFKGKDLESWKSFRKSRGEKEDKRIKNSTALYYYFYSIGTGSIGISAFNQMTREKQEILKRFRNVFAFAYRRYLDVAQAEAQAREAQIELALERVRAGAMAMRQSDELGQLIFVLYQELTKLDAKLDRCFIMIVHPENQGITWWMAGQEGLLAENGFFIQNNQHASHLWYLDCWRKRRKRWQYLLEGKEKRDWDRFGFTKTELTRLPEPVKKFMAGVKKIQLSGSSDQFGSLVTGSFEPLPDEHQEIINRFAVAFNQAYIRFLDLQKAEVQAREAQIQLTMERVRARTMAMQSSDELPVAANLLFQQVQSLGMPAWSAGYCIWDEKKQGVTLWMSSEGVMQPAFHAPLTKDPSFIHMREAFEKGRDFHVEEVGGKALVAHYKYMRTLPVVGEVLDSIIAAGHPLPVYQIFHCVYFSHGFLLFITYEPVPEAHVIFKRFGTVFDQTYTRFLDLQKAEAQAREAQIEASMEKVRSRSLAMQKPEELVEVAELLRNEMGHLGVEELETSSIYIVDKENEQAECWYAIKDIRQDHTKLVSDEMTITLAATRVGTEMGKFYRSRKEHTSVVMKGENRKEWINYCAGKSNVLQGYYGNEIPERTYHLVKFSGGYMGAASTGDISAESWDLLRRASSVFSLAYTRFRDLQDVAERAKEAQIELALERVRSKTMAMHNSEDVGDTVATMFDELVKLDVHTNRCGILIFDEEQWQAEVWTAKSNPAGKATLIIGQLDLTMHPLLRGIYQAWKNRVPVFKYAMSGDDLSAYYRAINNTRYYPTRFDLTTLPDKEIHTDFYFAEGCIFAFTPDPVTDEADSVFKRFANVFSQTYRRYLDLQKAEAQAREAQIEAALERVRSRSMAMHISEEFPEVIQVVFEQFRQLNFKVDSAQFDVSFRETDDFNLWTAVPGRPYPTRQHIPFTENAVFNTIKKAKEAGLDFVSNQFTVEEKTEFFEYFFKHATNIPEERRKFILSSPGFFRSAVILDKVSLGIQNYSGIPYTDAEHAILKRFAKAFEQTYTRFLDLQKSEAQARESQVEASLERVRSRTMAMHKSEDLSETSVVLFNELKKLGIQTTRSGFGIYDEANQAIQLWLTTVSGQLSDQNVSGSIPFQAHYAIRENYTAWKENKPMMVHTFSGSEVKDYYQKIGKYLSIAAQKKYPVKLVFSVFFFSAGSLNVMTEEPLTEDEIKIMLRFSNVFGLTYRRFLDLQKAEAQAREAQIEAALERVRSRSIGMQKSEELKDVIKVVYDQFVHLNIRLDHAGFVVDYQPKADWHFWIADKQEIPSKITHPYFESVWATQFNTAKEKGEELFVTCLNFEEKNKFYNELLSYVPGLPQASKDFYLNCPALAASTVLMENVGLYIENFEGTPYTDDEHLILMRFGKVFQQTYTRFLDLQKAEAQAREAQIESALERVRSRSLAMHHSSELSAVVDTLLREFTGLEFTLTFCIINLINEEDRSNTVWAANPETGKDPESYYMKFEEYPFHHAMWKAWKAQDKRFVYTIEGEEKRIYDQYLYTDTEFSRFPENVKQANRDLERYVAGFTFFRYSGLQTVSVNPITEAELEILERFGRVFEQSYTRFLDLQKAEAQAKEAQIEAALEKVRSRTMAMQSSNELQETAAVLFQEFKKLGTDDMYQVTIGIYNEAAQLIDFRVTSWADNGAQENRSFQLDMNEPTLLLPAVTAWRANKKSVVIDLTGEALEGWLNYRNRMSGITVRSQDTEGRRVISAAFFSKGHISISSPVPVSDETLRTLERFAAVFDGTYTRFLDLEKAEAQAREARIAAALERVRSRTLAMQRSEELVETAAVLFQQLIALGIEPNRLYISIINSEQGETEFWITDEEGRKVSTAFTAKMQDNATFLKMYEGWKQQRKSLVIDMQGEELQNYFRHLTGLGVSFKGGLEQKRRIQEIAYFSKGFIGMASPEEQPAETLELLERFAAVFNLTFTRFNDLKMAEAHARQAELDLIAIKEAKLKAEEALSVLQATQKQLVQAEKMASLGELTAGIAHEIQNPLNFVNNFSEVSNELISEMVDEVDKGNTEEVKAIARDVQQNLEKILHHGKRADGIVKGMLQHSRSSNGMKELTDINALADEYLRLAYHGLRAKDKSFNATLKTEFDDTIGSISVIPQDIGRVILNLITNAFYAVDEKKKRLPAGYDPEVIVTTRSQKSLSGDATIVISVKDNGSGVPQTVIDKIFQPFFTTKPTGQGTGLGLSLSYDIVKAHGGELKVETKEGEGSEFIIVLPI